jgi:hypothetical protein
MSTTLDIPKDSLKLRPTEKRLYDVLSDGEPHLVAELQKCLNDDMASLATLEVHISYLRTKVKPYGLGILRTRIRRGAHYQMVYFLPKKPTV